MFAPATARTARLTGRAMQESIFMPSPTASTRVTEPPAAQVEARLRWG